MADFRKQLIRDIFVQSVNRRLRNLSQSANAPFVGAGINIGPVFGYALKNECLQLDLVPVDQFGKAIDAAIGELVSTRQYGLTNADVQMTKNEYLARYEKAYNERNTTESTAYTDAFIVGNVKEDSLRPLLEQYMASLPISGLKPVYRDNCLRLVRDDKIFKFYKGGDKKSLILDFYHPTSEIRAGKSVQ